MDSLSGLVAILIALSVASERLVEIIKGMVSWLSQENPNATQERWRKIILQLLAAVTGIGTAFFAKAGLAQLESVKKLGLDNSSGMVLLGLLSSGGSGFWTSIQGYVAKVKDIKKVEAAEARVKAAATVAAVAKGGGVAFRSLSSDAQALATSGVAIVQVEGTTDKKAEKTAQDNLDDAINMANNVLGGPK